MTKNEQRKPFSHADEPDDGIVYGGEAHQQKKRSVKFIAIATAGLVATVGITTAVIFNTVIPDKETEAGNITTPATQTTTPRPSETFTLDDREAPAAQTAIESEKAKETEAKDSEPAEPSIASDFDMPKIVNGGSASRVVSSTAKLLGDEELENKAFATLNDAINKLNGHPAAMEGNVLSEEESDYQASIANATFYGNRKVVTSVAMTQYMNWTLSEDDVHLFENSNKLPRFSALFRNQDGKGTLYMDGYFDENLQAFDIAAIGMTDDGYLDLYNN